MQQRDISRRINQLSSTEPSEVYSRWQGNNTRPAPPMGEGRTPQQQCWVSTGSKSRPQQPALRSMSKKGSPARGVGQHPALTCFTPTGWFCCSRRLLILFVSFHTLKLKMALQVLTVATHCSIVESNCYVFTDCYMKCVSLSGNSLVGVFISNFKTMQTFF